MSDNDLRALRKKITTPEATRHFRIIRAACGSSRVRILYLLRSVKQGLTITEISKVLNASLSRISHQMCILKKSGLVAAEKSGRNVVYTGIASAVAHCVVLPE